MNRMTTLLAVATLAAVPLMQGCGSDAQVIEQDRSITSIDQIDIQDFRAAASTLTRQMLNDPRYASEVQRLKSQTPGGGAPIMKVSKIKNDTMLKVDMRGFLVDPMEAELAKSRTVDFFAEDAEAQSLAKMNEMRSGQGPRLPDLGTLWHGARTDRRSRPDEAGQLYIPLEAGQCIRDHHLAG